MRRRESYAVILSASTRHGTGLSRPKKVKKAAGKNKYRGLSNKHRAGGLGTGQDNGKAKGEQLIDFRIDGDFFML
jgi:hypothetical protein